MKRVASTLAVALLALVPAWAEPTREVRLREVDLRAGVPSDLRLPEGKSRWDLTGLTLGPLVSMSFTVDGYGLVVAESRSGAKGDARTTFIGDGVTRFWLPDRSGVLRIGDRVSLRLEERGEGGKASLFADVATIGIGWVELPSGPREVVLQRGTLRREEEGTSGFVPDRFFYRWVDPRAGVVAEASGPAATDGRSMTTLDRAVVLQEIVSGAADLKIYAEQVYKPDNVDLNWGWDRGAVAVSSLTPDGYATIGALIGANTWDFSQNGTGQEVAQLQTPLNSQETCNIGSCGYSNAGAGASLLRQDKYSGTTLTRKDNQVTVRENRAGDVTIWSRAGAQKEGTAGSFGTGETRYCYVSDAQRTRNPVPLWRFSHQDAAGWYMQPGDAWAGGPTTSCQQTLFNGVCGDTSGLFSVLYAKACTNGSGQTFNGTQGSAVVKTGVVKIPSGHTLNSQVVRTVGEFCVYSDSGCLLKVNEVRTVVYLWIVPYFGTVVLLQSPIEANDYTSWTTTDNTELTFGLYPPVSIASTGQTDTTVALSWNPGNDTRRITRYKVYWDTDPGAATAYAFNSDTHPGQVAFAAGPSATVSGLTPGTTYYFTVTSIADYVDPTRPDTPDVARSYESVKYPTQVSGDPSFVYPVEVQATTTGGTCIPTAAVTGVTVSKAGGLIEVCWNPVSDPCLQGYDVLGASSPVAAAGFTTVGQVGAATCWQGNPAEGYFLVVARGTGGTGPWGHFGQ